MGVAQFHGSVRSLSTLGLARNSSRNVGLLYIFDVQSEFSSDPPTHSVVISVQVCDHLLDV